MSASEITIYTIGHGRHPLPYFLGLLKTYEIAHLCDVRSIARSRWPQFSGPALAYALQEQRIGYEHLPECGGKIVAPPPVLAQGVERLLELAAEVRTVMMCSESRPLTDHRPQPRANCHRVGLLAPLLRARGVGRIVHILPDGDAVEFDESAMPSIW